MDQIDSAEVGAMDQGMSSAKWIQAYMEWTDADGWAFGTDRFARNGFGILAVNGSGEFAAAYLDWMDAWQMPRESHRHDHATAAASYPDGIDVDTNAIEIDRLWDAFMVALHTDSDCTPFLRRLIDGGDTRPRRLNTA